MKDMNYQIGVEVKESLSSLQKFKKAAAAFDKGREAALKRQIALLQKMKNLQAQVGKQSNRSNVGRAPSGAGKASNTVLANQLKNEEIAYNKTQQALTKRLAREEKERTRIAVAQAKARMKARQEANKISNARVRQSVGNLTAPTGAESMRSYYKELEKSQARAHNRQSKLAAAQRKAEKARLVRLHRAKQAIMNSALMTEREASAAHRAAQERIRGAMATARTTSELRRVVAQERAALRLARRRSFLVSRMEASSKQFAGNMVSAFAAVSGGVFITQQGQQFESAGNTMLSVSANAEEAGKNMQFVKDEAFRLGLGLTQATKGFAKLAAARGDISLEDTKELFLGISEASTVLGLRAEESNRALLAIQQMASKTKISAEELRLQLGEVLPQGIQLMANAAKKAGLTDGSVADLSKLMADGKAISSEILPHFAKELRNAAAANGGLLKALDSNRVAMNRLITATQSAADTIFKSGWSEGLTELFNSLAEMIKDNELLFTEFGKTMGKVFKGMTWIVENVIDPVFSALGSILHGVNRVMDEFGNWVALALAPLIKFTPVLGRVVKHFGGLRKVMGVVMRLATRMFLPFYLGLGVLEEIAEFFSPTGKKTLLRFNVENFKDPFKPWLDTLDNIVKKLSWILGVPADTKMVGTTKGVTPYNHPAFMTPRPQTTFQPPSPPIHVTVEVDGNKVAEAVATKPAMAEQMNRAMNRAFDPNYN